MSKFTCIFYSIIAVIIIIATGINIVNMSANANLVEIIINFIYIALSGVMLGLCIVHCALESTKQSVGDKFAEIDNRLDVMDNVISNLQEEVEETSWKMENPLGVDVGIGVGGDWVATYSNGGLGLQQIELPFTTGFYYIKTTKDKEVIIVKSEGEELTEYMIEDGVLVKIIKKTSKK